MVRCFAKLTVRLPYEWEAAVAITAKTKRRFATMSQIDVPQGRTGKHKEIVSSILAEIGDLKDGEALKIALHELTDSKENVRSALNRASQELNRPLATAADDKFLYVRNTKSMGRGCKL